ncbi:MAG: hypothetical protein AAB955_02910 [Patescibacteria group bacterium]
MKFFVTGRSNNYQRVAEAFQTIKDRGHEVAFEWTALPMAKPYAENGERAAHYAEITIKGLIDADVYIIFAHKDGNGVYTELGAALALNALRGSPRIYAIGMEERGAAMFNYHPAIIWKDSLEEVLDEVVRTEV